MKRVIIGLIAIGGVALSWTDARAQCNGVAVGGSCKTGGLLGRSLVGITRTLKPGEATFEFFGTGGPNCTHDFANGKLDCDCRITGTAYCSADSESITSLVQTLPAGLRVLAEQPDSMESPGGNGFGSSFWNVAEGEPPAGCVQCPLGTEFVTFTAGKVVMRETFCPDDEGPCQTTIRRCRGGSKLSPSKIGSFNCETVFECEGDACPEENTSGNCTLPDCAAF